MSAPRIYADISFITNFSMDFIILWATNKFIGSQVKYARLLIASLLGGIYAVAFLLKPSVLVFSTPAKIIISLLLVYIALKPSNWKEFRKAVLYFYIINFAVAGATLAIPYLFKKSGENPNFTYLWLLGGGICAIVLGLYGERYLNRHIIPQLMKFSVELKFAQNCCISQGFVDTGNNLLDPLTMKPVIVAEYAAIKECLPEDLRELMESNAEGEAILEALTNNSWACRLRLIPFTSLGKQNGLLIGVRSDEVIINLSHKKVVHKNMIVGIYREKLCSDESYHLLIPAGIIY